LKPSAEPGQKAAGIFKFDRPEILRRKASMHIGISRPPPPPEPWHDVDGALVARAAEALGFESVFYGEHPIRPIMGGAHQVHGAEIPYFQDTMVMLARSSAVTTKIKLGSAVFLLPVHHPVLFAKQLASIDFYSSGRLIVGAGVGWSRIECEAMGGNFDRRWGQAKETIQIMRKLWTEEVVEFHGEFYDVPPISLAPKPKCKPWPQILLPGPSFDAGEPMDSPRCKTAFKRIVELGDGWIPFLAGTDQIKSGMKDIAEGRKVMNRLCEAAGRNPDALQVTVILRTEIQDGDLRWPELVSKETLRRYADIGVERCLVTVPTIADDGKVDDVLARVAEAIL
jgi:probable F420-dependent oxidoreductase